jgi:cytochrome c oxidase subunit 1
MGAYVQLLAGLLFAYIIVKGLRSRANAGRDPWGAPTIEWSIPSPPPDYNFATIPTITSRYPMWDMKSPRLTADVPHVRREDERSDVEIAGKHLGSFHDHMNAGTPLGGVNVSSVQTEAGVADYPETGSHPTARELGIPMPNPTIRPLIVAGFMVLMFASVVLMHVEKMKAVAPYMIGTFALAMVASLYSWLLTPLEDEH